MSTGAQKIRWVCRNLNTLYFFHYTLHMFKYIADNRESAWSVLGAGLRLYFSSFLYTLTLSIIATLTFLSARVVFSGPLPLDKPYQVALLSILPPLLSLVFFIPLVKRIYSVGAQLPISTARAFDGFFTHYLRMALFVLICTLASLIFPVIWILTKPQLNPHVQAWIMIFVILFYIFIGLKVYFTALFIILENKGIIEAVKASIKIEHNQTWLTFSVLALYFFGYWALVNFVTEHIIWQALGIDLVTEFISVIALPLFLCIQITQFFNLKVLANEETA